MCLSLVILYSYAEGIDKLETGQSLPPVELLDVEGKPTSFEEFRGSAALLVYIRSDQEDSRTLLEDCRSWQSSMPELKIAAILSKLPETRYDVDFPILIDPEREVYGVWGVRVLPTIVLIDKEGKLFKTKSGYGLGAAQVLQDDLEILLGIKTEDEIEAERTETSTEGSFDSAAIRHFHAGKKLWDNGFLERAHNEWKESIKRDSIYTQPRIYLGKYYLQIDEIENAKAQFEIALDLEETSEILTLLSRSEILLGDLENAETHIEQALDLNRRSSEAKLTLAEIYILQGDSFEAESLIDEVKLLNSNHPRVYYLLGRISESAGDSQEAIRNYRRALDILLSD
jgi:tetratricopeptide (TPR) repeat protein